MNHPSLEICTCGYSTYSKKWMKKHLVKEHNESTLFNYISLEHEVKV